MPGYGNLETEIGHIFDEIKSVAHTGETNVVAAAHAAEAKVKSLVEKLLGEAKADAADVEHAAGPVVAKAEEEAGQLAKDAVAEAEAVVEGGSKPSA